MPDAHDDRLTAPDGWKVSAQLANANALQTEAMKQPITAAENAAYRDAMAQPNEIVMAEGALIGEAAIDVMKNLTPQVAATARIWSVQETFSCPLYQRSGLPRHQPLLPAPI